VTASELEHFAALAKMAGAVSRELVGPIATLMANLAFAADLLHPTTHATGAEPSAGRRALDVSTLRSAVFDALECAAQARDVVLQLQSLHLSDEDEDAVARLSDALDVAVMFARGDIHPRARLVVDVADDLHVRAPRMRLAELVFVLLSSAAATIDEGNADHNAIHVRASSRDGEVRLEISDSGAGHSPAQLADLERHDARAPGAPLRSAKALAAALGADLAITSVEGRGTTVSFALRLAPPVARREPAGLSSDAGVGDAPIRALLVVDDDLAFGAALRRAVGDAFHVSIAGTADAALAELRRATSPDLFVVRLFLPQSTGMDLYDEITADRPDLADRFVFVTDGRSNARSRSFLSRTGRPAVHRAEVVPRLMELLHARAARRA
jgi:CheY-like chemotaxis protein